MPGSRPALHRAPTCWRLPAVPLTANNTAERGLCGIVVHRRMRGPSGAETMDRLGACPPACDMHIAGRVPPGACKARLARPDRLIACA